MSLISNGIKRRAVYRFKCSGVCGKRKVTFVYERARDRVCLSCSKLVNINQPSLFSQTIEKMHDAAGQIIKAHGGLV